MTNSPQSSANKSHPITAEDIKDTLKMLSEQPVDPFTIVDFLTIGAHNREHIGNPQDGCQWCNRLYRD